MVLGSLAFGAIALALWVAVVWRAVQVGPGGPLWWATICVAVIVTLKTGVVADPFNLATGGVYLDVVIQHVLGVVAATLILLRLAVLGRALVADTPDRAGLTSQAFRRDRRACGVCDAGRGPARSRPVRGGGSSGAGRCCRG